MKDLIRTIRAKANMNQEQFASALGTTAVSINRWENGKALPNQMAQTNIFQFCKAQGIDVAALIVEMLHYEHTEGRNIFYHGSKKGIVGDIGLPSVVRSATLVEASIWAPEHSSH